MKAEQFALHADLEEKHWWFTSRRRIAAALIRRLLHHAPAQEANGGRPMILDIGCGTGGNIAALAGEYSCVGVDPSPEGIDLARRRYPQVRFVCGKIPQDVEPLAREADLFLLMDVLEHVPDDRALLSPLVSAAKPRSVFLITVPADMRLWSEHDVSFGHFRRYERESLEKCWAGLPLEPLLVSYYNHRLYPLARVARGLSRIRGKAWGENGTDLSLPPRPMNRLFERIFSGEAPRLVRQMEGKRDSGFGSGVSLIAVLRKEVRHAG